MKKNYVFFPRMLFSVCLIFVLKGCGPGPQTLFSEKNSPNNQFTFQVSVAEPKKIIGCEFCRRPFFIYGTLKDNSNFKKWTVFQTRLENDGIPFDKRNISLRWVSENKLIVCLRASDLPKKGYHVSFSDDLIVSDLNDC